MSSSWTDKLPYPALFTYPVARRIAFRQKFWVWPGWIINIGILVFFCGIIPVTVMTQGYQTVSTYEVNHNATLNRWFNKPAPGSECDPHIFSLGDTFVTNIGSFTWTLSAANSDYSGIKSGGLNASNIITMGQYTGTSLDWCDVTTIHVAADYEDWKLEVGAVILCYNKDFILANTVVHAGWEDDAWFREKTTNINMPSTWVQVPVQMAATDMLTQMRNLAEITNASRTLQQLAITGFPTQCPRQYLKDPKGFLATVSPLLVSQRTWCTQDDLTAPPALGVEFNLNQFQNLPVNVPIPVPDLLNAWNNTMQAMLAAVRWDLGNLLPNNFLSNTREVLTQNETFFVPFTTTTANSGALFNYLTINAWNTTESFADLRLPDVPVFLVPFLCHLYTLKSAGSLFISVLVGTLSICTSAWGLLLVISAVLYKWGKQPEIINACDAHANAHVDSTVDSSDAGVEGDATRPGFPHGNTSFTVESDSKKLTEGT